MALGASPQALEPPRIKDAFIATVIAMLDNKGPIAEVRYSYSGHRASLSYSEPK